MKLVEGFRSRLFENKNIAGPALRWANVAPEDRGLENGPVRSLVYTSCGISYIQFYYPFDMDVDRQGQFGDEERVRSVVRRK